MADVYVVAETSEILDILSTYEPENYHVLMLFHATKNGRLLDYSGYIVEDSFFTQLSAYVTDINIFSCFPDKVMDYYSRSLMGIIKSGVRVHQPLLKKQLKSINKIPLDFLRYYTYLTHKLLFPELFETTDPHGR